jgi:excisionase family DNA binding protein
MTESNPIWSPDTPLLFTKAQCAALLNVSERTIGNLLRRRELVRRKIGSRTLIPRTSIEAFLRRDHPTQVAGQVGQRAKALAGSKSRDLKELQEIPSLSE